MKRFYSSCMVLIMMVTLGSLAFATDGQKKPAGVKKSPVVIKITPEQKIATATAAFQKDFPNAKFSKVEESGIEGLYEVTTGPNIIFYSPAAGRIIFGEMLDKTGKNLTADKRQPLIAQQEAEKEKQSAETAKLIDTLPLDKAIKIGSGKNVVIEFTDIDCAYCRKAEEFFKTREDVTRYVFLFPLEQIHPKSVAKSKEVLCAKDPAKAYKAAISGDLDNKELKGCGSTEKSIDTILAEYKSAALKMGVNGTPMMWVNKKQVNGADTRKLEQYLAEGATDTNKEIGTQSENRKEVKK